MQKKIVLCFLSLLSVCVSYDILVFFPLPGKSHSILGEGYVKLLLEDGHKVTYITPFPIKKAHQNLTQIDCSDPNASRDTEALKFDKIINKEISLDKSMVLTIMIMLTRVGLLNSGVQELMRNPNTHFDLVISEWMFSETSAGLSPLFNCPYIWAVPMEPSWMTLQLIDERPNPSYSTDFLSYHTPPFSFIQRAEELVQRLAGLYFKNVVSYKSDDAMYNEIFGPIFESQGRKLPALDEVIYNASLILGNSHVSMGQAVSLPQNYKPIGGYHIDPNVKPLPEDLQKIMDNAKDGVIYVSMGSNLKSKDLPEQIKKDLLEMFGGLKQTVIWKFEEKLADLPKNVHIVQWAPQPSILAHPNARIFVTHGGLLSTTETIHFGVPTIGLPVFGDQFTNVARAAAKGYAKEITWSYDVGRDLKEAIDEVLNNPKYTNRAKELSHIYHSRPVPPSEELKYWVRHVIETGGARHLRSTALMMPWYQKMYLDHAALAAIVLFVLIKIVKTVCCSRTKKEKVKKN